MAVINTNTITIAGTHGTATLSKTKIVYRLGGFEFPAPYQLKMNGYIHLFVTNGSEDWDMINSINLPSLTPGKRKLIIEYNGLTDGDLFLFVDNKVIEHVLSLYPSLDPAKLVSEFQT